MAKPTIREFLENRSFLALKLSSGELSGLFQKRLSVPMNTVGLALYPDGACALIPGGQEVRGRFDLLLAKEGDFDLPFPVENLRGRDGHAVQASVTLSFRLQTRRDDLLRDFERSYFNFPGHFTLADLKNALGPDLRRLIGEFAAARDAAELHRRDVSAAISEFLRPALERSLFGAGLDLVRVGESAFESPGYAKKADAEARLDEDRRAREEKLRRKEDKIRRLATLLQDQSMRDLLEKIPDDRARGLLYAKLMEDDSLDLDARKLVSRLTKAPDDLSDLVFRTMEGLLSSTSVLEAQGLEAETADRIFLAAGSKVLEFDPAAPREKPREYVFKDPLRSVRPAEVAGNPVLLVGAKRSVHILTPGPKVDCDEYPLPGDRSPKGGVNSVALVDDHLFATHSEYGLVRWDRTRPGQPGTPFHESLTIRHKTVRGVTAVGHRVLFAAGPLVYAAAAADVRVPEAYSTGLDSPVTALAIGGGLIYAGTESGAVVSWMLGQPGHPVVLVRGKDPVANLRLARICSIPHLLYSAREPAVRARVIGQTLETSYESGGPGIGALDAASDLVAATDHAGRRLYLWRASVPAKPEAEVDLTRLAEKPALDLGFRKVKAAAPAAAGDA